MTEEQKQPEKTWTQQLVEQIEAFHQATGMKHTTIGAKSIENGHMWKRLSSGGTISLKSADRIRSWLTENLPILTQKGNDQ